MIEIANVRVSGTNARSRGQNIPFGLVGGYITVDYIDSIWKSLVKTVVFKSSKTIDVITEDTRINIPVEVLQNVGKRVYVGFYGTDAEGNLAIPTVWTEIGTVVEAADPSGDESADPALPVWAQLEEHVRKYTDMVDTLNEDIDGTVASSVQKYLEENPPSGGVDFKTDHTLKLENGILSVNTTDLMERDNTLPITSAGVYATVGNIEALLNTI